MLGWQEPHYERAKWHAARRLSPGPVAPRDMPTNREVREHLRQLAVEQAEFKDGSYGTHWSAELAAKVDPYVLFRSLVAPLEHIKTDPREFPEGDLLYHTLQVFERVRAQRDFDEELLSAALLHEVGQAIDSHDPVGAALANLEGAITERTAWFLQFHESAHAHWEGSLGMRSRRRLAESDDFEDLLLLAECDRAGHVCGAVVPDLDEALACLRELDRAAEDL